MPEWVVALVVALVGLLGVVLGVGIQEFRQWRESKERYQVMTFERRLVVHQKAFYLCHKLDRVLPSGDVPRIRLVAEETRQWWDSNCLLVDEDSREAMMRLIYAADDYAIETEEFGVRFEHGVFRLVGIALEAIVKGIGVKHLPETQRETNSRI